MPSPVADVAGGGEAEVVDVVDVVAGDGVAAGTGALTVSAGLVTAAVRQQFLADVSVRVHPHPDVGVRVTGRVVAGHGSMIGPAADGNQVAVPSGAGFPGAAHPRSRVERRGDIRGPAQASLPGPCHEQRADHGCRAPGDTAAWFRFHGATNVMVTQLL